MARERFRGFVELSGLVRRYISKVDERRLLEQGIGQFELAPDEARSIVSDVSLVHQIKLERDIDRQILDTLLLDNGKKRKVGRRRFKRAVTHYKALAGSALTDAEARSLVKQVMEGNLFRPKRGGLTFSRRWYKRADKANKKSTRLSLLSRNN